MIRFNGVKSESEWNREFCKAITLCNAQVFACAASMMQTPGWPDRYIAHPLFCGWVECKRNKNDLTGAQCNIITSLNRIRAGTAFIIWLEHDALYPTHVSWFSENRLYTKDNGAWPFVTVDKLDTPIRLLQTLCSVQHNERIAAREGGNIYA